MPTLDWEVRSSNPSVYIIFQQVSENVVFVLITTNLNFHGTSNTSRHYINFYKCKNWQLRKFENFKDFTFLNIFYFFNVFYSVLGHHCQMVDRLLSCKRKVCCKRSGCKRDIRNVVFILGMQTWVLSLSYFDVAVLGFSWVLYYVKM